MTVQTHSQSGLPPFAYEEFLLWYAQIVAGRLEPALLQSRTTLNQVLDETLPESQRVRVRVGQGRVKSPQRTWAKLVTKYLSSITEFDDVVAHVDDLVGLRITCNNLTDLRTVQELLESLPAYEACTHQVLAPHPGSWRDYMTLPKPSGYRAVHVNLSTTIAIGLIQHEVTCELQLRTLLMDSWGELTHEDTYKPDSARSALIVNLSRRIADLLSTLDDVAEDLRVELDRHEEDVSSTKTVSAPPSEDGTDDTLVKSAKDSLINTVRTRTRPVDLASLAWHLQREFGTEISQGWFGYGSFKEFLLEAIPNVHLIEEPPAYVVPPGYEANREDLVSVRFPDKVFSEFPEAMVAMAQIDSSFPLLPSPQWPRLFEYLASGTLHAGDGDGSDVRWVNRVTKLARDEAAANGTQLPRRAFNYVAQGLRFAGNLFPGMAPAEVKAHFRVWILSRMQAFALLGTDDQASRVGSWLDGAPMPPSNGPDDV